MNSCRVRDAERNAAVAEVQVVYSDLAARPIDRRCTLRTECCHFKLTGLTPFLTKGEALLAAKALRASGRRKISDRKDGACPLLDPETLALPRLSGSSFRVSHPFLRSGGWTLLASGGSRFDPAARTR